MSRRARQISRPEIALAVEAGLEGVAAAGAETLRQAPAAATASEHKAQTRVRRDAIVHAGGIAVRTRGDVAGAGRGTSPLVWLLPPKPAPQARQR